MVDSCEMIVVGTSSCCWCISYVLLVSPLLLALDVGNNNEGYSLIK